MWHVLAAASFYRWSTPPIVLRHWNGLIGLGWWICPVIPCFFKEKWPWSSALEKMILHTERTNENHTLFCDGRGSHFLFLANKWIFLLIGNRQNVVYVRFLALLTLIKETCLIHWFLLFNKSIHFMLMTFTPINIFENNFHFRSIQFHSFY